MLKRTAVLLMCCAGLVMPAVADETDELEPHLINPGQLIDQHYLAYTLEEHDQLSGQQQEDEDLIAALRDEIVDLKAVIAHAQANADLEKILIRKAEVQSDIYKSQIPGFWKRNFGQCFWKGVVAGYAGNELVSDEP